MQPFLLGHTLSDDADRQTVVSDGNEQHIVMGSNLADERLQASVSIGKVNLDHSFSTSGNGGEQDDAEPSPTKY